MPFFLACLLFFSLFLSFFSPVLARVTAADQLNAQQQAYDQTVSHYSASHQQQLQQLTTDIAGLNKKYTDQLDQLAQTQGEILDEYQARHPSEKRTQNQLTYHTPRDELAGNDRGEQVRYWITYAHEAVAFQAAKKYIINLHGEGSIKSDAKSTVSILRSDLASARQKVVNSQKMLEQLVNE